MTQAVKLAQIGSPGVSTGFKNRIINGNMAIDQRNAGASVTNGATTAYTLDRFQYYASQASKFTIQQNAGSVTPPVGFTNYVGITSLSAYTPAAGEQFIFGQMIEGFNTADLQFGTANAKTVTLSFWVRSSLTGTFGASLINNGYTRSYPFSYVINVANTWEQKTVTIAGDTTGTWIGATNGTGIRLYFSLGCGSNSQGTANAWVASEKETVTGETQIVGTNGATFYITGVQLEVGTTATDFEYRDYGRELALCYRYYWKIANGNEGGVGIVSMNVAKTPQVYLYPPATMRTQPTVDQTASQYRFNTNADENINMTWILATSESTGAVVHLSGSASASTSNAGSAGPCRIYTNGGYLAFTAEL